MNTEEQAYFQSGAFRKLLKTYEQSVESGHSAYIDADDLADIADYYQYNGFVDKAKQAIDLALELNPNAVGPLLYKAREAIQDKDFKAAEDYADQIDAADELEALLLRGEILICQELIEEADQLFIENLRDIMDDELTDYVYDVANLYSEYLQFDKAFEWIARSQGDDSDSFKELMARTLFGLEKYQECESIFNELIDHDPYSTRYWNALAGSQFMRGDFSASITSCEYAIAIDPQNSESLLSKANCLYHLGNMESALTYYKRYSEQVPEDEFSYLYQGICLYNLGRFEEAIQVEKKGLENSTAESRYLAEIYQNLAFCHLELDEHDKALYYLEQADLLDDDHVNTKIAKGHILLAADRQTEASKAFKEAFLLSDRSPEVLFRIAISYYENRYILAAYSFLKYMFENVPEDWNEGYSYMVLCCYDLKKEEEFMHYLKLATEKNPAEAQKVLGDMFPKGTDPKDYFNYIMKELDKNTDK